MIIYFPVETFLSSLTVPLFLRYLAISLAFNVAAAAVYVLLLHFGVIRIGIAGIIICVAAGCGVVAGAYFRRRQGRLAKWGECWRISAVLLSPHIVLTSLNLAIAFATWITSFDKELLETSPFLGEMILNACFIILMMLTISAIAFRFGSQMTTLPAKGWRNLRE